MPREDTQFKPGQSGNPKGRPKSFARRIREETESGEELVEYALLIWRDGGRPHKERWDAHNWLVEYGWGKAPSHAPVEDGDPLELADIDHELRRLEDELAARREAKKTGSAAADGVAGNGKTGAASA